MLMLSIVTGDSKRDSGDEESRIDSEDDYNDYSYPYHFVQEKFLVRCIT